MTNYDFKITVVEKLWRGRFTYVDDFFNVENWLPTSKICHQHEWSASSVTNINVAV